MLNELRDSTSQLCTVACKMARFLNYMCAIWRQLWEHHSLVINTQTKTTNEFLLHTVSQSLTWMSLYQRVVDQGDTAALGDMSLQNTWPKYLNNVPPKALKWARSWSQLLVLCVARWKLVFVFSREDVVRNDGCCCLELRSSVSLCFLSFQTMAQTKKSKILLESRSKETWNFLSPHQLYQVMKLLEIVVFVETGFISGIY